MNKKIKNLFLAGALVLGLAGVTVSCTDYDKDINDLQNKITDVQGTVGTLSTNVAALQAAINAGAVITSVAETGDGYKVTLSDGKTMTIKNGKDGNDGKDGKDGKWYTPNAETGCWDVHEMVNGKEVVTPTTQKYLPDNGTSIEYDVENNALIITKGEETAVLNLTASGETSLVFIPTCYVDGVEGFEAVSFFYAPLYVEDQDSEDEIWAPDEEEDLVQISPAKGVQFHVNISNAELDDTYTYEFINKTDKKFHSTRAPQTDDFDVIPTFTSYEDGILSLAVEVVGKEATDDLITTMALQVSKDDVCLVSDYFTVISGTIENLRIADPKAVVKECKPEVENYEEHYRRGTVGISEVDDEDNYRPDIEVWTGGDDVDTDVYASCDTTVAYTGSLDLKTITIAHYVLGTEEEEETLDETLDKAAEEEEEGTCFEMTAEEMEAYGLKFVYEVVLNYEIGEPKTPQDQFVTLEDGVFTPRVYTTDGTAAIGRTPIIRVKIMDGENVVEVAYIKVYISQSEGPAPSFELVPKRDAKDDGENIFRFNCDGDMLITTVKDMNEILYNGMSMSKAQFHAAYDTLLIAPQKDTIGTVRDSVVSEIEGTHVIVWEMTADELWENSGKPVEIIARYQASGNDKLYVDVKLTATIEEVGKTVALTYDADYIKNYWVPNTDMPGKAPYGEEALATRFNVNVPTAGDKNPDNCQFQVNINSAFKTVLDPNDADFGKLLVENVDSVAYFFCKKDVEKIKKIGDLNVKFRVCETLDSLYASIVDDKGKEVVADSLVAWIVNEPTEKGQLKVWNMFNYVKGGTVADTLLNTDKMFTYIGAKAYLCSANEDVETKELDITFEGKDHFEADILQPVYVSTVSKGGFKDAVDFGKEGSYIDIADLLDPYDWRGTPDYKFSNKGNENYWDYYGPFSVVIDANGAQVKFSKDGEYEPIPATIVLTQIPPHQTSVVDPGSPSGATVTLPDSESGYLTYKNNSNNVSAFGLRVKAKVKYGFGYINTDWIEIPVETTEGQGD